MHIIGYYLYCLDCISAVAQLDNSRDLKLKLALTAATYIVAGIKILTQEKGGYTGILLAQYIQN